VLFKISIVVKPWKPTTFRMLEIHKLLETRTLKTLDCYISFQLVLPTSVHNCWHRYKSPHCKSKCTSIDSFVDNTDNC
jgi:hypothetical protein